MRVLGAILAGGGSLRLGPDTALTPRRGRRLVDHVRAALERQCAAVILVGRAEGIPDWPAPALGPLGGIAAALRYAGARGYDHVLTCGVDSLGLSANLVRHLAPAPACLEEQTLVGLWPVAASGAVARRLRLSENHSVGAFADDIGARRVAVDFFLANANRPAEPAELEQHHGL